MYLLYNILLIITLIITSPFLIYKIITKEKHRKGLMQKLGILPKDLHYPPPLPTKIPSPLRGEGQGGGELRRFSDEKRIHIHAVSVGEVLAIAPFVKELKKRHPELKIIFSTVTPTGNELARKRIPEADHIIYFPFDFPWVVKKVVKTIRPQIYVTVETEIWPNFLRIVKQYGAKTIMINGRISPHTYKGYSYISVFMKKVLANVDLLCMQSDEDARRIIAIGAPEHAVSVTGNMKYDQRFADISESEMKKKRELFGIKNDDSVIIAGSTHRGEDEIILDAFKDCLNSTGKVRLIIVPRHIERAGEIEKLIQSKGLEPVKRTGLNDTVKNAFTHNTVVVGDTIGELSTLYSIASVVIMGGSFIPHGGQNPLEAMYYKKPVIFGQHTFNFREITEVIIKTGAGIRVEKNEELPGVLKELLSNLQRQREMGEKGYQIIIKNRGAVEKNLSVIEKLLSAL
ncbi:MAG: 3-deoxy-D-manno-octulosonic acid transferase [Nitrospirae bacterium]|nr:3-deoxy-D-manno-octulosonic acid transferase [Nitrospirota bacterium]